MQVKVVRYKRDLTYDNARNWIFSDSDFLKEFDGIVEKEKLSKLKSKDECERYLKEIAATYSKSKSFWNIMEVVVRRRIVNSFDNIYYNKDGVKSIKNLAKDYIVNLAPNHRSVFDFMILSYILVKETTFMPIILAADVFNTFPLGQIFRKFGAYFVRRKVDNALYSLVFKYYVMMISKCELIHMFFIEGGRNKTGGYSQPKKGILKYILDGAKKYSSSDIVFVPVSISYDCVPESKVVIEESKSGKRKHIFQSVANYLYRSGLGNCYIKFGKPIKISNSGRKTSKTIDELGDKLVETIKSLVIVTPTSLVCYTLIGTDAVNYNDFKKKFKSNYNKLKELKCDISYVDLSQIEKYLEFARKKGIIDFDKRNGTINAKGNKKAIVQYYSNNILHLFKKNTRQ